MQRREFITFLGGTAVSWPVAAYAQAAMPVVGFMNIMSPESIPHWVAAFHQGLKDTGFVEGQNVAVEYRWANGEYDRSSWPILYVDMSRYWPQLVAIRRRR
jgi:putative ABC transport system substrate-binding protein